MFADLAKRWHRSRVIRKFQRDRVAFVSLCVIALYAFVFAWTLFLDLDPFTVDRMPPQQRAWLQTYNQDHGKKQASPSWQHPLGTDRLGRDILTRLFVSIHVAFKIGLGTAFFACLLGMILGGFAGYLGGWVDIVITWLHSIFASIPYILLILLLAAIFRHSSGLWGIYIAFGATFWIGPCRLVRSEILKLKELEYVQAAQAVGNSKLAILFRHILPNTFHLVFVSFSLIFISAIKSEVVLSFLGLGVKRMPSWGLMLEAASLEIIAGFWWQMLGASFALFILVYAFNVFTDALQDAFDPKHPH